MENAIPAKAWRSFLLQMDDVLFPQDLQNNSFKMIPISKIFVGIFVQGTSVRRVRVRAFKRVRNGKTEQVRAHWRYLKR